MSKMLSDANKDIPLINKGPSLLSGKFAFVGLELTKLQRDAAHLLDKEKQVCLRHMFSADQLVGQAGHASGWFAERLAQTFSKEYLTIEDGFLKGFSPQINELPHSYVIRKAGSLSESGNWQRSRMITIEQCPASERSKVDMLIKLIRTNRLSQYNNRPTVRTEKTDLVANKPYVIVVDHHLRGGRLFPNKRETDSARKLLDFAQDFANGKSIVICRESSASKEGLIAKMALDMRLNVTFSREVNNWPLIEDADAILTMSGQLGLEALLADKPVHLFEDSFFAGLGLTVDHFDADKRSSGRDVNDVFYSAYCLNSRYIDVHKREPCTIETSIDQAICIRDQRLRLGKRVVTVGFSPWKRAATNALLVARDGKALHRLFLSAAKRKAKHFDAGLAVWGKKSGSNADYYIEDGFIRSKGLGVNLTFPASLAIDSQRPHYDCRGPSELESALQNKIFEPAVLERARRLMSLLITMDISKYNIQQTFDFPAVKPGVLRILVPGQVATDQSIQLGAPALNSNKELVSAVRELFPTAFIVYKVHPDVAAGHRSGGIEPNKQDLTVSSGSITKWLAWADRVETITSLAGFEALIRNKAVGVHGLPFYAGWGLTEDRTPINRRTRRLGLDELVAGALIEYPFYVHPISRMPCNVETMIAALANK